MNIFDLPVHPAADIFPMLDLDELADLAADIKANGLQHPIIVGEVDGETMLIDGRNRLAACGLAKINPEYQMLGDQSPESLIMSENIMRRHMTKGARAMAVAKMFPEKEKGGRGNSSKIEAFKLGGYLSMARTVISFASEFVDAVIGGSKTLSDAYEIAKERKEAPQDDGLRLSKLKVSHPDLADKVIEGELTLPGAEAEGKERDRIAKVQRGATLRLMGRVAGLNSLFNSESNMEYTTSMITTFSDEYKEENGEDAGEFIAALESLKSGIAAYQKSLGA